MQHLPLFATLVGRPCLVVGGGQVAERRVRLLLGAGAKPTVLTESANEALEALARSGAITLEIARYESQPVDAYWLVVAATNDAEVNARVARAAETAQRFCNVVDDPDNCTFIMPAIVDRDPVTIAISSAGNSPVLARWIKGVIETAVPVRVGALARLAKKWRARVAERLADQADRRHFWQAVVDSDVAEHAFAGRMQASEAALSSALKNWAAGSAAPTRGGEAYLVGAGPGAADLLTLRGRDLLAHADTVLYDRLVNPEILAYARRDAEFICVGKTPGKPSTKQAEINALLVRLVEQGKTVCRLKGGDPMIFGRAGEELEALTKAGLRFQIVPGVSAIEGCAAYAGIPLTLRGVSQSVLITTGHTEAGFAASLGTVRPDQTIALYMGVAHYAAIAEELIANGLSATTPAAVVENGTTDAQRVIRTELGRLAESCARLRVRAPALLFVGATAAQAQAYAWFSPVIADYAGSAAPGALADVS